MAAERLLEPTGMVVDQIASYGLGKIWGATIYPSVALDPDGIPGDRHNGPTRTVRRYESPELAGVEVDNDRQISIVHANDMEAIAADLKLPIDAIRYKTGLTIARYMALMLAANVLVTSPDEDGLPEPLTIAGANWTFGRPVRPAPDSITGKSKPPVVAAIKLTEYNAPCSQPVTQLIDSFEELGLGLPGGLERGELVDVFKSAAARRRGWVAAVHSAGPIAVGQHIYNFASLLVPGPDSAPATES